MTCALALVLVPAAAAKSVSIFYYPWYGTPGLDGGYEMWSQNGHFPPQDIYSPFFPARGVYSSSNPKLVDNQLAEIARAGVDQVVVSWWGWGSPTDKRLPFVVRTAGKYGLSVAIHIEPFDGRTAAAVAGDVQHLAEAGIRDVYVFDAQKIPLADWQAVNLKLPGMNVFAQTGQVGFAKAAGFTGVYTYDIVTYGGQRFGRYCAQAHKAGLLCAPSVGPGFDSVRAVASPQLKLRHQGRTYDAMWKAAIRASADVVTITSYNEWGEGTQIEPAKALDGYASYNGAWGLRGRAAERAYLDHTASWAARYRHG
jgi:glycoprotein endo-alpha-1,2-mannosidase